jgi:hypothetical protein
MGECYFYLKAKFPSTQHLKKVYPDIQKFLKEGQKAEEWWQNHRGDKPKIFWTAFETNFPTVTQYLKHAGKFGADNNNGLSGQLEFGNNEVEQATGI